MRAYSLGTNVYVGGLFTTVSGNSARYVAGFSSGNLNSLFSLPVGSPNGLHHASGGAYVKAMAPDVSNNLLYVGGIFTATNTVSPVTTNNVAKWNPATNSWSALSGTGGNGTNMPVNSLKVFNGNVYVGGDFFCTGTNIDYPTCTGGIPAPFIAEWNDATSTWYSLSSGLTGSVFALTVSPSLQLTVVP